MHGVAQCASACADALGGSSVVADGSFLLFFGSMSCACNNIGPNKY